ncbi:MAG: thioredoxin family protein [Anaerolineaceae bacterium]|nr:thioredoxin family protein [Anaerolineaceae bacterium]
MKLIQIVGVGCPRCRQMTAEVKAVVAQLAIDVAIGHIDDPLTIVQMGIFSAPQLMIDGELVRFRYRGRRSIEELLRNSHLTINQSKQE